MSSMKSSVDSCQLSVVGNGDARSVGDTGNGQLSNDNSSAGPRYWRSLDELADTSEFREFVHREFPSGASELLDSGDRRHFLKIMGASMALAGVGMAGCRRWPEEHIVPYARRPEGRMPGVPVQYATMMELGGVAHGLLVMSFDGRPVKIEGNPLHPVNQGATDAIMQASVLDLYDPDRSTGVRHDGEASDWANFRAWLETRLAGLRGARGLGLAVLSEATSSPTVLRLRRELARRYPEVRWHEYEAINNDNEFNGSILAFGTPHRTIYNFSRANVIISLDSDFLMSHPAMVAHSRQFAQGRRANDPDRTMNRLYVCEGAHSVTGANADRRYATRSADMGIVAGRLLHHILGGPTFDAFYDSELHTPPGAAADWLEQMAADLLANRGQSIVIAGRNQPAEVHMLAHLLNNVLGNDAVEGAPIRHIELPAPDAQVAHLTSLRELAADYESGQLDTLIIIGGNPVYDAPADVDFAAILRGLRERGGAAAHLSLYEDETSQLCDWHVNRAHALEAWGDGLAWDGTVCLAQPLIEPLFDGVSAVELLAAMASEEGDGRQLVQQTFSQWRGDDEGVWRKALHDGLVEASELPPASPRFRREAVPLVARAVRERFTPPQGTEVEVELIFLRDNTLHDGRFANNGWLQELPDVMSKVTWDNALLINPARGKQLGVKTGDLVTVTVGGRSLEVPVLLLPGHHEGCASIALGYGRRFEGRIAAGAGFDSYRLRTTEAMGFTPARIAKSRGSYVLARTQDHYAIEPGMTGVGGRGAQKRIPSLIREATREEYLRDPKFVKHPEGLHVLHRLSLWEENLPFHRQAGYEGAQHAWAMSIDLSACTGCQACVAACQAENNIPIVGKDQVRRSREMHWLRVDRYFRTDDINRPDAEARPDSVSFAPIPCMHCENAPCEQVCPVAATVHDKDGLNVMIYNRCIGTRYCSNNCPYKVRRFNYFDYYRRKPFRETGLLHVDGEYYTTPQAQADPLRQMQFNPEVTIRSRGVMEKCTFCVQRITRERIKAKNEWVKLPEEAKRATPEAGAAGRIPVADGAVTPACAQACPAQAIVFGDLLDKDSRVYNLHNHHDRTYEMLEELNTKPRTRYMGKLRNPPPAGNGSA